MHQLNQIESLIQSAARGGDILLVIPPFGSIYDQSLGLHIIQSSAREKGFNVDILYLNILMASLLGLEEYQHVSSFPKHLMIGERLFSRSAYGLPPLGRNTEDPTSDSLATWGDKDRETLLSAIHPYFDTGRFMKLEQASYQFIEESVRIICSLDYKIIGCTIMMEQVNASIAFLNRIKSVSPQTLTIVGGGHCEAQLAEGMLTLSQNIDYVFSGESEQSFITFLENFYSRNLPLKRTIIKGQPVENMDHLPLPDYSFFFNQHELFLGEQSPKDKKVWYETSRGCWWSDILKCTYCGIVHLPFRQKSIPKVLQDLESIKKISSQQTVYMVDSVMPQSYHKDLLPEITDNDKYPPVGYMVRPSLKLKELVKLKKAGINATLPGIESFSPNHLKLMQKGVNGRQNLLFLRHALSLGIYSDWLMLYAFPGDVVEDYQELLDLIPLLRHLQPPRRCYPVLMMRFSPYMDNPGDFEISNVTVPAVLSSVYPETADKEKLAVYYIADYPTAAGDHKDLVRELNREVSTWREKWRQTNLAMAPMMGAFIIYDNRDIHHKEKTHVLDYDKARAIMTSRKHDGSDLLQWALQEKLGVLMESWYVPLVTASAELLLKFESDETPIK